MPRKLLPYAIRSVTVAMPQTIPSIVSRLRVTLRFSAIQASAMISISITKSVQCARSYTKRKQDFLPGPSSFVVHAFTLQPHTARPQSDQSKPRDEPDIERPPQRSLPTHQRLSIQKSSWEPGPQRSPA